MVEDFVWCVLCRFTYNSQLDGHTTFGGYSNSVVVTQDFVLRVPDNLSMAGVAPLLCAGVTGSPSLDLPV